MWDVREKRTEEGWSQALSKFTKETLDTARTWVSLVFAAAALTFLGQTQATPELGVAGHLLTFLATAALFRYFLLEMGFKNILGRPDRVGFIFDVAVNVALFGVAYWFLRDATERIVEAAVKLHGM